MSLALAQSFVPAYAALPAYFRRSMVGISPRFPYDGATAALPASGITGTAGTITPVASPVECAAWGADSVWWTYSELAGARGYASTAAFTAALKAAGVQRVQAATNTSSVSVGSGPYAKDLAGTSWSANSNPPRPPLVSGSYTAGQEYQRVGITVTMMPLSDQSGTITPKLAIVAASMSAGSDAIQLDDPRGPVGSAGFKGPVSYFDLTPQGVDFSDTAVAGFAVWLAANTSSGERTALGLPADPTGLDIRTWLASNYPSSINNGNQVNPALVDQYLWRTSVSTSTVQREVFLGLYNRYQRAAIGDFIGQLRSSLAGAPLSGNFWQASPAEFVSGMFRRGLFDFAIAETAPPYWGQLSPYTIDTQQWYDARLAQCARQHMNAATYDLAGLRALVEHKPTAPNAAPPRLLRQILRQSNLQSIAEGVSPLPPIDVFLTTNDPDSQGVSVDGYRFWGSRADYGDIWDFIRANAALLDGYEKLATVHLAAHNGTFPFQNGSGATRYAAVMTRLAALMSRDVDYHWLTVGEAGGLLPQEPDAYRIANAPLVIRVQDESDYYTHLTPLGVGNCRPWGIDAANEAMRFSPVRSHSAYVRAFARYSASARRVSVHLYNLRVNTDGTPRPETALLRWKWGGAGVASVARLGESASTVDLSPGFAQVTLREYAIVNFAGT